MYQVCFKFSELCFAKNLQDWIKFDKDVTEIKRVNFFETQYS